MLRSVQVLRCLAACSVVVLHTYYRAHHGTRPAFELGAAGVDLFFVISGFIMATIAKRPTFLFDRVWRIYPLWLIAVLPWLWLERHGLNWSTLAASLTLWPTYDKFTWPALDVGWTLSFEMLFYCAVAASMRIGVRIPLVLFGLCLAGGILTDAPIFDYLGSPMIFEFLFGVIIAQLPKNEKWALPILSVALLLLLTLSPQGVSTKGIATNADTAWMRILFWGIPCAMLFYATVTYERVFKSRAWDIPVLLGNASFSIYLFHTLIIRQLRVPWPAVLVATICTGVVMWWVVERRILALKPVLDSGSPPFVWRPPDPAGGLSRGRRNSNVQSPLPLPRCSTVTHRDS
jgi:exopolysaccharide production protein ExoZ